METFAKLYAVPHDVRLETTPIAGVPCEALRAGAAGPTLLYLHGGGYVAGSPRSHRHLAAGLAHRLGGHVVVPDYRLAPEYRFPAALEDVLACYRALATDGPVAIAGDSAGGGLSFSLAIAARDEGLPPPQCIVALSPWVALTTNNPAYDDLAALDPLLSREICSWHAMRYLGDTAPTTPEASPLFADLTGLPPVLIQVGDHEVLFGDAARMHQKLLAASVPSELSIWNGMFHVWHLYWPTLAEGAAAIDAVAAFVARSRR